MARGGSGEQAPDEDEIKKPTKQLMPYEKVFKQGTQFKTTCNPDVVEAALIEHLEKQGIKPNVDGEKYKVKFE